MNHKLPKVKQEMDSIYSSTSLSDIPWNIETPPPCLVKLLESCKIKPCRAIDLGCGAGNYVIYLTSKGFDMTGIDISEEAIKIAGKNAGDKVINCNFIVADMLGDIAHIKQTYDFAYDYEVLHHIFPQQRLKYVQNVLKLLNEGAHYLSVCFSEKDTTFAGSGKYRKTRLGTELYFSSEDELKVLFEPSFKIEELKTIEITGKNISHFANYVFMTKK